MADTPVLRFNDVPIGGGGRRVEVSWQDGPVRQVAVSPFAYQLSAADAEKVRWYLEEYPEFPADPAPQMALEAEAVLAGTGSGLFAKVFAGTDATGIWTLARSRLEQVRVEVDTDPGEAPGLPWELLRDPGSDVALALDAEVFVRTHLRAAPRVRLPEAGGDRLRVLLVICRPGRDEDVPFRSVAGQLARGGGAEMDGLDLDVLRPATFARLDQVLHDAAAAGRPYHVVHFDGHGTYLDVTDLEEDGDGAAGGGVGGGIRVSPLRYGLSVAGPVRAGEHGYLIFEDPDGPANQQLVGGPTLGRLLAATGVPVLVLNACRSAYTEASPQPGQADALVGDHGAAEQNGPTADAEDSGAGESGSGGTGSGPTGPREDVHSRIRAYGSLAAEVADAGVPGVVAMRYNVYVVTAAQFVADLYAHLLAGRSLGEAATAARRALAADPDRQIGAVPVALQDWAVPVVYEAAALRLIEAGAREAPLVRLSTADEVGADGLAGVPRAPDVGFFGRDETLLALDRAFDHQQVVLLQAFAGAGKSSTAAEFARWYAGTGGLDRPGVGSGVVLWSSFEHHLPLDRLVGTAGDRFARLLESNGIHWQAITDPAERRELLLQILEQVPALWVWDNIEPVAGFPSGTESAWSRAEQDGLTDFLRDLTQRTWCKVLLTSRRDERGWLAGLPARLELPSMPMQERVQLAAAIAARDGLRVLDGNWRPLLRFSGGNPLAITVLVRQALREGLVSREAMAAFVDRLRAGEADLEPGEDAALGRTRSLAASLSYGFARAFTDAERDQLAVLHLFREAVNAHALQYMGDPGTVGDNAVPQLAGLDRDAAVALLDKAAAIGLLTPLGSGYYAIHPALPWYFTNLFVAAYGPSGEPGAELVANAYSNALGLHGRVYANQYLTGAGNPIPTLRVQEANLHHALALALRQRDWQDALDCLQGLSVLYERTGRDGAWARLVGDVTPDFIDQATDGPLLEREEQWSTFTQYRVKLARKARNWPDATRLQRARVAWDRERAAVALSTPEDQLTPDQRNQIRTLAVGVEHLGHVLREQDDPGCLTHFKEAIGLFQRIGALTEEANIAGSLGSAYVTVPGLRDLDQAERWHRRGLELRTDQNWSGLPVALTTLATIAHERFREAQRAGAEKSLLLSYLNAAMADLRRALAMSSPDHHEAQATIHNEAGNIYASAGDTRQAQHHYQQSIQHHEAHGSNYGAGQTRFNMALLLDRDQRPGDALRYAPPPCMTSSGPGPVPPIESPKPGISLPGSNSG